MTVLESLTFQAFQKEHLLQGYSVQLHEIAGVWDIVAIIEIKLAVERTFPFKSM